MSISNRIDGITPPRFWLDGSLSTLNNFIMFINYSNWLFGDSGAIIYCGFIYIFFAVSYPPFASSSQVPYTVYLAVRPSHGNLYDQWRVVSVRKRLDPYTHGLHMLFGRQNEARSSRMRGSAMTYKPLWPIAGGLPHGEAWPARACVIAAIHPDLGCWLFPSIRTRPGVRACAAAHWKRRVQSAFEALIICLSSFASACNRGLASAQTQPYETPIVFYVLFYIFSFYYVLLWASGHIEYLNKPHRY